MTDKELIQALRHCASDDEYGCLRCPGESTCDECTGKSLLDAADRLEALLAENEHLREATKMIPKWVSVAERLPEKEGKYLCTLQSAVNQDAALVGVLYYGKPGFYLDCVTHWMPLPSTEGVE